MAPATPVVIKQCSAHNVDGMQLPELTVTGIASIHYPLVAGGGGGNTPKVDLFIVTK